MRSTMFTIVHVVVVVVVLVVSLAEGARRRDAVEVAAERGSRMVKRDLNDLNDVGPRLGMPEGTDIKQQDSMITVQGNERRRYQETFKGRKVYNTVVDTEIEGSDDENGDIEVIDGSVFDDLADDLGDLINCLLTKDEAKQITLGNMSLSSSDVFFENYDDIIYVDEATNETKNVKEVQLSLDPSTGPIVRPFAFVDQCTGEVLFAYDQAGGVAGAAAEATLGDEQKGQHVKRYLGGDYLGDDFLGDDFLRDDFLGDDFLEGDWTDLGGTNNGNNNGWPPSTGKSGPPAKPNSPPVQSCDVKDKGGNPKRTVQFGQDENCLGSMIRSKDRKWCYLENEYIKTVDLDHSTDPSKSKIVTFECAKGLDDEVNGGYSATLDGFFYTTKTFEMYKNWYNYRPFNNDELYVKVHFKKDYANALWDGQHLLFGDGGYNQYPFTVADIVAHELGHGVIGKTSQLEYKGQSGGMNEAFADMAGETAEAFMFGTPDWKTGADLFRTPHGALRYFDNPSKDGVSIKHASFYREGIDVHHSSGVYNHAFWYLSERLGLGIRAAFECFLKANRFYWSSTTTFEQGACGVIRGAYDSGYDMDKVAASFKFVGITLNYCRDLSKLVTAELKQGRIQNRVQVSNVRQPVFKINLPAGTDQLTVKASGGVGVAISKSYRRQVKPLASGVGSAGVKGHLTRPTTLYVRVFTNSPQEQSIEIQPHIIMAKTRQSW